MSTALTTQNPPLTQQLVKREPRTIADILQTEHVRRQVAMALPKFLAPERMLRIALTTINRSADLQKCTPESLLSSLMTASAMGIEPDGRHGHLIARFNSRLGKHECQFQADYKGLVALVRKSGDVSDIYADVVCEADAFRITKGLHRDLVHEVDIRKPRGEFLGVYSVIVYKDGPPGFDFMSKEEVDAIRDRSDGWKAYVAKRIQSTPWSTDYNEMAKKTVLKRLLKLADLSGETSERVALDVDATVAPSVHVGAPEIARPQFDLPETGEQPAPTVSNGDMPQPPADSPRRRTRQAKAIEVPAETPAHVAPITPAIAQADAQSEAGERMAALDKTDDIALPGGEPEPSPQNDESAVARLRRQHPDATDAHLLKILIRYNLAEPATKKLADVPAPKLERLMKDPDTVAAEVAALIEAEA